MGKHVANEPAVVHEQDPVRPVGRRTTVTSRIDAMKLRHEAGADVGIIEREPDPARLPRLAGDPDIGDPRHEIDRLEESRE
jgi:hypothetical protein